jgi:hypothetical protein
MRLTAILCLFSGILSACLSSAENSPSESPTPAKYNGISLEGPPNKVPPAIFKGMEAVHGNSVSLMPYAYMENLSDPNLITNPSWQWWGERQEGIIECIRMTHDENMSVMVKPHIWVKNGAFTGNINMNADSSWSEFENRYLNYILAYAIICDSMNVEVLCIGTEMKAFVASRPTFWNSLIDSVQQHYSGTLTYAENWDCYQDVPFWSELDYIGIDAYFPLTDSKTPSVQELVSSWSNQKSILKSYRDKIGKDILFTEYGYRSIDYCAKAPWESYEKAAHNEQAQSNAYEAFYKTYWHESWIRGGYLWKWFSKPKIGNSDNTFAVQDKLAIELVKEYYK